MAIQTPEQAEPTPSSAAANAEEMAERNGSQATLGAASVGLAGTAAAAMSSPLGAAAGEAADGSVSADVTMVDAAESAASPAPGGLANSSAPSPLPARTSTPMRNTANSEQPGGGTGSRAASAHPPEPGFTMPAEAPAHGAPVRQYINTKVTGPLLEGMKLIAKDQPQDPLRVLGEYLIQRSKELEGTS